MVIRTLNSIYSLVAVGSKFSVRKLKALSPSDYIAVGEQRFVQSVYIEVGQVAQFDHGLPSAWHTSRVERVTEGPVDVEEDL